MGLPLASAVHFSKWQRWHAFKDAKSYLWSSSSFSSFFEIFQFLNFGGDLDGDENIRRKMRDAFEDETIGELPSPGILEKFFLMEIRWFPFFSLTLKFRENSKSHRVVEMLQDIWRLLSPENENGREMTMKVVAINGGFYLMESVFQEEYVLLARIPSSSKRSNKRSADRIPYDRWRHHVAEKEENEENEGARDRRNIIILKTYKIRIECIKRS